MRATISIEIELKEKFSNEFPGEDGDGEVDMANDIADKIRYAVLKSDMTLAVTDVSVQFIEDDNGETIWRLS